MSNKNKIISVKTANGTNFYNILPETVLQAFSDRDTEKKLYYRSNTHEEEEHQKNDNLIFEQLDTFQQELIDNPPKTPEKVKKYPHKNNKIFYTNDPIDPKDFNLLTNNHSETSSRYAPTIRSKNKNGGVDEKKSSKFLAVTKNGSSSHIRQPTDIENLSISFYGHQDKTDDGNCEINIFDKYKKNHKKFKLSVGDFHTPIEFEEDIFKEFKEIGGFKTGGMVRITDSPQMNKNLKKRTSAIFKFVSEEEIKLMRERSPTPENQKMTKSESPVMKRSMSKEFIKGREIEIPNGAPKEKGISLETNIQIEKKAEKLLPIYTNQNSRIVLPPNCKIFLKK